MCKSAPSMLFYSKATQRGYYSRPDCNNWGCPECRPELERKWASHAAAMFLTCPDGIGYHRVKLSQIQGVIRKLQRARAQFLRVRGHVIYHVYSTRPSLAPNRLSPEQATEMLTEHLALAPSGEGRVITTSRAWKIGSPPSPSQDADTLCIGIGISLAIVKAVLADLNQRSGFHNDVFTFRLENSEIAAEFARRVESAVLDCRPCYKELSRAYNHDDTDPGQWDWHELQRPLRHRKRLEPLLTP